jgi:hypothetical protein
MRVNVQSVEGCRVSVVSSIGTVTGTWVGSSPALKQDYAVELDVQGVVPWEKINDAGPNGTPLAMERPDGLVSLTGRVDEIDEDLVLQLWLGETSVMIDTAGDPPLGIVGRFVEVVLEDLALFLVDY